MLRGRGAACQAAPPSCELAGCGRASQRQQDGVWCRGFLSRRTGVRFARVRRSAKQKRRSRPPRQSAAPRSPSPLLRLSCVAMADARFCVGFSSACMQAREGGGLPSAQQGALRVMADGSYSFTPRRPSLPPDIIRLIDALVRRLEHEDTLLSMNGGVLGTTMCQAATAGGILDVRFLLARGANLEATTVFVNERGDEHQWTALVWASFNGHLGVATALLDANAAQRDRALRNSSGRGHTPVVALLLDHGADIHFEEDGPLMMAAQHGRLATATLLLDRGVDVNAQNGGPIGVAAQVGQLEMVGFLLDRGANIHARNDAALCLAVAHGHLEMGRLLLDRGADLQAQNSTPLRLAAQSGHLETVRLLLDRGADVHAANERPLQNARRNGHAAVVALLLERGALEPNL